ncbi:hypothetical protein [Coralloluteibacterium stylophorae]|uniref:YtxH domain-containing protein n=1 Tax=Coralloluteibacterium stylophorae TaxID=1776034 RepID=A0A8J7VU48_9GAMM|nr:hypothetical protein [Coralloluteibacterium stylophorae]MBS7457523.1 hypothetical protein [Coralloluteibacterium stylophorae]
MKTPHILFASALALAATQLAACHADTPEGEAREAQAERSWEEAGAEVRQAASATGEAIGDSTRTAAERTGAAMQEAGQDLEHAAAHDDDEVPPADAEPPRGD